MVNFNVESICFCSGGPWINCFLICTVFVKTYLCADSLKSGRTKKELKQVSQSNMRPLKSTVPLSKHCYQKQAAEWQVWVSSLLNSHEVLIAFIKQTKQKECETFFSSVGSISINIFLSLPLTCRQRTSVFFPCVISIWNYLQLLFLWTQATGAQSCGYMLKFHCKSTMPFTLCCSNTLPNHFWRQKPASRAYPRGIES